MRLPNTAHTARPWRVHEITRDFQIEDVWALPTPGGPHDLPRLAELMTADDDLTDWSRPARLLWELRWKLGALFGWDEDDSGIGARVASLRERMPADLLAAPRGPAFPPTLPFRPLYLLDDEFAAEMANVTVHAVLHLGWVPDGAGGYRGQLTSLVKPNGRLGAAYMATIKPLRRLIVYPTLLDSIGRDWRRRPVPAPAEARAPDGNR